MFTWRFWDRAAYNHQSLKTGAAAAKGLKGHGRTAKALCRSGYSVTAYETGGQPGSPGRYINVDNFR
jgi:hypothetical protein